MSRPLLAVALAGMLLLAGCSGSPGTATEPAVNDSTTATASATATDAAGTATPPAGLDFAPGTSADGVVNASALLEAHLSALNGSDYRVRATQTANDRTTNILVAESGDRLRMRANGSATTTNDIWSTADRSITRRGTGDTATYTVAGAGTPAAGIAENLSSLYVAAPLASVEYGEFAYDGTAEHDGEQLLRFVATGVNQSAIDSANVSSVSSYDATLLVSEDGVVHEATIDVTAESENESRSSSTEYAAATGIELERPSWLSNVPELSVSLNDDATLVTVEHEGGPAVENATVSVGMLGPSGTIEGTFEAGETRYLGVEASSGDSVITAERPDTSGLKTLDAPVTFRVLTETVQLSLRAGG